MFNHSFTGATFWGYDNDRKGFVVLAHEDIKKGDEIPFSYGFKSNKEFFM